MSFDFASHSHRRYNPLTDEWILVSPHRNKRPWQGQEEAASTAQTESYVSDCYLCPGNQRMGGQRNPQYRATYVFTNDFPALELSGPAHDAQDPLFRSQAEQGGCRVIAYSPDHSKTLAQLSAAHINSVIGCWIDQYQDLGQQFPWVQIFENKGEIMGCSMPHPHGQVWAQQHAPTALVKEDRTQQRYLDQHNHNLLLSYAEREFEREERVVTANELWLAVVPYWAAWPFETLLLPRFPAQRMTELNPAQREQLAELLQQLLVRYDNLFQCPFPYSMGWHGAPFDGNEHPHWQLHAHFYPPLLRSQTVRKFMVGYEMLAEPQRDITAEQAAAILRDLPQTHYTATTGEDVHG